MTDTWVVCIMGIKLSNPDANDAFEGLAGPVFLALRGLSLGSELPGFMETLPLTSEELPQGFAQ